MGTLELKVPPPLVIVISAALMWLVSWSWPALDFEFSIRVPFAIGLVIAGFAIGTTGVLTFRKAKTTVNPMKPESAAAMVNWGIYSVTRNPMYLGGLVMLTGWAIFLSNALAFLFLSAYVAYIDRFQIEPEERALTSLFEQEFVAYRARVRRWL